MKKRLRKEILISDPPFVVGSKRLFWINKRDRSWGCIDGKAFLQNSLTFPDHIHEILFSLFIFPDYFLYISCFRFPFFYIFFLFFYFPFPHVLMIFFLVFALQFFFFLCSSSFSAKYLPFCFRSFRSKI